MKRFLVLSILALFGAASSAEVIRCTDAAGKVSYTDGSCPSGAKRVARVDVTEPLAVTDPGAYVPPVQPPPQPPQAAAQPVPSGPIIIDTRGGVGNSSNNNNNNHGNDPVVADDGYYPYYGGGYRQPGPPRDMRPRLRNCDSAGCSDTQGNHYNRSGQVDHYRSLDGKRCTPIGTTQVCR